MWKFKIVSFNLIPATLDELDRKYINRVADSAKIVQSEMNRRDWFIWYREPMKLHGPTKKKKIRR